MPTTQQPTLSLQGEATNRLLKDISRATHVICGEVHGVCENFSVYRALLETGLFGGFAYELLDKWEIDLQTYLDQKVSRISSAVISEWKQMAQEGLIDGKISEELITFLKYMRENYTSLPIVLFDPTHYPQSFSWNLRDSLMANRINKWSSTYIERRPLLIATGSLHARTKLFSRKGVAYTSLGVRLKNERTLFIRLKYESGEYYNITRKKFYKTSNRHPFGYVTRDSDDYIIHLPRAHAITPLAKLKRKPHLKKIT